MNADRLEVRDLTATHPDDYPAQEFDVLAHCSDGRVRHSDATFSERGEAEAFIVGGDFDDLDQWTVVPAAKA